MEMRKTYDPSGIEQKWYQYWLEKKYFHSEPDDRTPFTIVIPPPNVTGMLHMGHVLNNTLQDVFVRRARMQGFNACWVPGTDHASIATEAKVVAMLRERGIKKSTLSRDAFMQYAWEWKEKYGGIILQQLKELGCSCDWDRTAFTMDLAYYEDVIDVFIDLYNKGYIYRGQRMINWDPEAKTALSNEEVIYKEVRSKLYYVQYKSADGNDFLTIATTRPETILGDTAICVHPDDERYAHWIGKQVLVPIVNRSIPVIADTYVDREFGTGALKITPAHDPNDYEIGQRHQLEIINMMEEDGTVSEAAGLLVGEDRFIARKKLLALIEEAGQLVKVEEIVNNVGFSERTDAVVEPRLSMQWWLNMQEISKPALDAVNDGTVKLHPEKFANTYRHWMENVRDWCISRQLWWGHRIPAWYNENKEMVVAKSVAEAAEKFAAAGLSAHGLVQDEDVLDTWASSWLWPISVFDGIQDPNGKDINYYYPTNVLVTAPEILFFWVARMIIAGYAYRNDRPFDHVYLTGIVRDKQRRKMSKSLGNSPDPLDLIKQYGADGVRLGMLLCAPAGNDILFDEKQVEQGRNFCNKLWNVYRLVSSWEVSNQPMPERNQAVINWFHAKLQATIRQVDEHFANFRVSDALMALYTFTWDDFCSWYLEYIKPGFGQPIDQATYEQTIQFFEIQLHLLHPIMPFVTEELYHELRNRPLGDDLVIGNWPVSENFDEAIIATGERAKEIITAIRDVRSRNGMSPKDAVMLYSEGSTEGLDVFLPALSKLANLTGIAPIVDTVSGIGFLAGGVKWKLEGEAALNPEEQRKSLEEQLAYTKGFLESVAKKLSNERFVNSAPANVVDMEKKKMEDAREKIKMLEESLQALS
jgi:valyl-tRNA synthetase